MGVIAESLRIEVSGAIASLKQAEGALRRTDEAAEGAKDSFGAVGGGAAKLAGAAGLLSPALGPVAMNIADLADVGEVAAQAASALGLSMGVVGTALGAVALAAGVAVMAIAPFRDEAERLRARAEEVAGELEKMKEGLQGIVDLEKELTQRELKLVDPNAALHLEAAEQAAARFADQIGTVKNQIGAENEALREAERELRRQEQALQDLNRQRAIQPVTSEGNSAAADRYAAAVTEQEARVQAASAAIGNHRAQVAALDVQLADLTGQQGAYAGRLVQVTQAERAAAEAGRSQAQATKETNAELARGAQALEQRANVVRQTAEAYLDAQDPIRAYFRQLRELDLLEAQNAITAAEGAAARDAAAATYIERTNQMAAAARKLADAERDAWKQEMERYAEGDYYNAGGGQSTQPALGSTEKPPELLPSMTNTMQAAGGGNLPGVVTGLADVLGAVDALGLANTAGAAAGLSAAGPIVAAIVAAIQLVNSIVPEAGEDGAIGEIHNMMMEFFGDIGELSDALVDGLEQSIVEGIPALADGLASLVESLPEAIGRGIVVSVRDLPKALADALASWLNKLNPFKKDRDGDGKGMNISGEALAAFITGTAQGGVSEGARRAAEAEADRQGRSRSIPTSAPHAFARPPDHVQRMQADLGGILNTTDKRNNLTSVRGVFYGPYTRPRTT